MNKKETNRFYEDIKKFNEIYKLPLNDKPKLFGVERLENFKLILTEEVNEVDEIIAKYQKSGKSLSDETKIDILTELSDWLGDIVVYIASECLRYGINLDNVLEIIMQSNFSKLGEDNEPIYDERGKVMKGPNYWRPEKKISELLRSSLDN